VSAERPLPGDVEVEHDLDWLDAPEPTYEDGEELLPDEQVEKLLLPPQSQ